jgi:hypothetical protein
MISGRNCLVEVLRNIFVLFFREGDKIKNNKDVRTCSTLFTGSTAPLGSGL